MVNENTLLTKLKITLEADSIFKKRIKQHGTSSKIVFGDARPMINLPYIQFLIVPNDMDIATTQSEILLLINIYSRELNTGLPDLSEIENIADRIHALFHDATITPTDHRIHAMYSEGRQTIIRDREREKTYIGGLRCRLHAIKL